jgi:hypothetical protein
LQSPEELEAVENRHVDIRHDDVGPAAPHRFEAAQPVFRLIHAVAGGGQLQADQLAHDAAVLHDQYLGHGRNIRAGRCQAAEVIPLSGGSYND